MVYTLSITVPRESTISPTSAGSELRKYTSLINVVAACQGKVFMYLTIKTNHIRIRVLWNQIFFFLALSHGTRNVLKQGHFFFLSNAFIKPIYLLIRALFLGLNCMHCCSIAEIDTQPDLKAAWRFRNGASQCIGPGWVLIISGNLVGSMLCQSP